RGRRGVERPHRGRATEARARRTLPGHLACLGRGARRLLGAARGFDAALRLDRSGPRRGVGAPHADFDVAYLEPELAEMRGRLDELDDLEKILIGQVAVRHLDMIAGGGKRLQ